MQMPVMGGVEATRAIRHIAGYQRTPILALTASAFEADRQSCLNAGMNDHLVKPVLPDTLYAALHQWLPVPACLAAADVAASTISQEIALPVAPKIDLPVLAGLDVNVGLAYMRGRPAFYRRCLELLVRDHLSDTATIREDLCYGRFADARRRAHSLKGASAMLGAEAIRSTAARIEMLLSEQGFPEPSSDALEVELITLAQALADLSLALVTTAQSGHQTDSLFAIKK
jgi:two-component system sensor histidine kinase/response regulator